MHGFNSEISQFSPSEKSSLGFRDLSSVLYLSHKFLTVLSCSPGNFVWKRLMVHVHYLSSLARWKSHVLSSWSFGVSRTSATFLLHSVIFLGDIKSLKGPVGSGNLLIGFNYFNSAILLAKREVTFNYEVFTDQLSTPVLRNEAWIRTLWRGLTSGIFMGTFYDVFFAIEYFAIKTWWQNFAQKLHPVEKSSYTVLHTWCVRYYFFFF